MRNTIVFPRYICFDCPRPEGSLDNEMRVREMKRIFIIFTCLLLLLVDTAVSQETKMVQEPEYIGVFFHLEGKGDLDGLERQMPEQKVKVKGFGFGGGEGYMQIKGEKSPIRFKTDSKLEFVVLAASQQTDPMSLIQFYSFEPKKGMRQLMMAKVGSMGISSKDVTNQSSVSFNAAKYGASSFKITPAYELKPGEYCLSTASTATAFCFGIDAASNP